MLTEPSSASAPDTLFLEQRSPDEPPLSVLSRVAAACDEGKAQRAYELVRPFPAPDTWRGLDALLVGSRLASLLGAPALEQRLALRARRRAPHDPRVVWRHGWTLLALRGPWEAHRWLGSHPVPNFASAEDLLHGDVVHAFALTALRDFDRARVLVDRAEARVSGHQSVVVARAWLLERQDRLQDALELAREGLQVPSLERRLVGLTARLLVGLDRDEEAVDLLGRAVAELEVGALAWQLADLLGKLGRQDACWRMLDRTEQLLSPWAEPATKQALAAARSDCAYLRGDFPRAIAEARGAGSDGMSRLAERLERAPTTARRVHLDVPWVRQHHLTCAPATLAALARFWGLPARHLSIAEEICYDGTPFHSQRQWAESHGFVVRDFRLTLESAKALLERGVPFSLATTAPTSAHMQAVVGYDERRGTFLLRDPSSPFETEVFAEEFLHAQRASGPRAAVLVPSERAELLASLELPDSTLYDRLHRLERALHEHERATASLERAALEREAPGHRLALVARLAIANYDANPAERVAALEGELALFPGDTRLELAALWAARDVMPLRPWLARAEACSAAPKAHPALQDALASALVRDGREHSRAGRLLRGSIRQQPDADLPLSLLADVHWAKRDFEQALDLYRLASCAASAHEARARSYFIATRVLERSEEGLSFLRARCDAWGARAPGPAVTLAWALEALERGNEALEALQQALCIRPEDGELLLEAAQLRARFGAVDEGRALLRAAEPLAKRTSWLRAASAIEAGDGALEASAEYLREVLVVEPFAEDAHRDLAQRLAALRDPEEAARHVELAARSYPNHLPLRRLELTWKADAAPEERERALRAFLEVDPSDAWVRRELTSLLLQRSLLDEAEAEARAAQAIEPAHPFQALLEARLHRLRGRADAAREKLHGALAESGDCVPAIEELFDLEASPERRQADLAQVERAVYDRALDGEGVRTWVAMARAWLPLTEVLPRVQRRLAERADLPAAWSVAVSELLRLERLSEAASLAAEATGRFPLVASAWLDRASVAAALGILGDEIRALEKALEVAPAHVEAAHRLADAHLRHGAAPRAREVLEHTVGRSPLVVSLRLALATLLRNDGQDAAARDAVRRALIIEPRHAGAWSTLLRWAQPGRGAAEVIAEARRLAEARPHCAGAQLALSVVLQEVGDLDAALDAAEKAIEASPRFGDAHDARAVLLDALGRRVEARAACRPAVYGERGEDLPVELRGRAAWLLAQRGDHEGAVREMRAALTRNPAYAWGWLRLVEWLEQAGKLEEALEAARGLVRVAPRLAGAHGALAALALKHGDAATARAALERALVLEPSYVFAGATLARLCADEGDLAAAERAVATLKTAAPGVPALSAEVRVAALARRADDALGAFRALCLSPDATAEHLAPARQQLIIAGLGDRVLAELDQLVRMREAHGAVGETWLTAHRARGPWGISQITALDATLPAAAEAARVLVDELAKAGSAWRLRWWLLRHRAWLRRSDATWAACGYVFASHGCWTEVMLWMRDWQSREALQPWMLQNLTVALHNWSRHGTAARIHRVAAALEPADQTTLRHRAWVALEDLSRGDAALALRLEPWFAGPTEDAWTRVLLTAVRAGLLVTREDRSSLRGGYHEATSLVDSVLPSRVWGLGGSPPQRHARRLVGRAIARRVRSPRAWLWRYQDILVWPLLMVGFACVIVFSVAIASLLRGPSRGLAVWPLSAVFWFWFLRLAARSKQ